MLLFPNHRRSFGFLNSEHSFTVDQFLTASIADEARHKVYEPFVTNLDFARLEPPTAALRSRYMPLFREHHVAVLFTGHEHLFEHWVERYTDASGAHRIDEIVTGGGGAPLYGYQGEPDLTEYLKTGTANDVRVQHVVKPGVDPGTNPHHFTLVRVDGDRFEIEVIGVEWGTNYRPYQSNKTDMRDQ